MGGATGGGGGIGLREVPQGGDWTVGGATGGGGIGLWEVPWGGGLDCGRCHRGGGSDCGRCHRGGGSDCGRCHGSGLLSGASEACVAVLGIRVWQ